MQWKRKLDYIIKILLLNIATIENTHIKSANPFIGKHSLNKTGAVTERAGWIEC
jgi:hypothetical protein